ncbi:MAG: hypothetical protein JXA99_02795 [Candidatus Lokiarchaeota archaeon]|nr:hypothetical protein [Candidatus Lokiarchaeota archaeon]
MIKEKTVWIVMVGIALAFILYLSIDMFIPDYLKLVTFLLLLIGFELLVFLIFNKRKKKKEKSDDQFDYLFNEK